MKSAKDLREGLLVLGLFLDDAMCKNKELVINGNNEVISNYLIVYGEKISIVTLFNNIKKIIFTINRYDERYIIDRGDAITFLDSNQNLIIFKNSTV